VQRIKSNHRYIKVGQQDRFQAMIDKLMQRTVIMSKEEFKSTIDMIQSEFPTTGTWLKWHFDNVTIAGMNMPESCWSLSGEIVHKRKMI